jgi:plastocyanin
VIGTRALRLALGACVLFALGSATTARAAPLAALVEVTIQNFAFAPASITIEKGDTVHWTNLDSASHSAVSIAPGFVTINLTQNQSATTTFDRPGTYDYLCGVHGASMRGTVIVRGTPVADTPAPSRALGHIVVDTFAEARPDRLETPSGMGAPFIYASIVLALLTLARFVWVLRNA